MTLGSTVQWARRNWISCLLMAAIVAALNWGPGGEATSGVGPNPNPVPAAPPQPASPDDAEQAARNQALEDALYRNHVRERERITAKSRIENQIENLEDTIEPYEYASRLCALGNLYQQKNGDYETAAGYYALLIDDYPDWPGIASAYHQLVACYKHMNDQIALRQLYKRMIETFPEGSPEHEYAKAALM